MDFHSIAQPEKCLNNCRFDELILFFYFFGGVIRLLHYVGGSKCNRAMTKCHDDFFCFFDYP